MCIRDSYEIDGQYLTVPANRMVLFWAGIPHKLTTVRKSADGENLLCNIYLPLDSFLMMPHITPLQVALLGGGMVVLPKALCEVQHLRRWYSAVSYTHLDVYKRQVVHVDRGARRNVGKPLVHDQRARIGREADAEQVFGVKLLIVLHQRNTLCRIAATDKGVHILHHRLFKRQQVQFSGSIGPVVDRRCRACLLYTSRCV